MIEILLPIHLERRWLYQVMACTIQFLSPSHSPTLPPAHSLKLSLSLSLSSLPNSIHNPYQQHSIKNIHKQKSCVRYYQYNVNNLLSDYIL